MPDERDRIEKLRAMANQSVCQVRPELPEKDAPNGRWRDPIFSA
jgi:hypothetical protein